MNREIKFRCFEESTKVMHKSRDTLKALDFEAGLAYVVGQCKGGRWLSFDGRNLHEKTSLQQFTGLHDCNGVEIYEGDIVQFDDGEWGFHGVIEYNDYGYMITIDEKDKESLAEFATVDLKVIGNIHQPPELLGGGQ